MVYTRRTYNCTVKEGVIVYAKVLCYYLMCREDEFAEVFGYVEGKLQEGTGGCIYISGKQQQQATSYG